MTDTSPVTYTGSGQTRLRDLRTLADFAAVAAVQYDTVSAYRSRGYLPEPIGNVGGTPVWSDAQMRRWATTRPGRGAPGRPRPVARVTTCAYPKDSAGEHNHDDCLDALA